MSSEPLRLRYYADPVLRQKADPVTEFTPELRDLIDGMFVVMYREEGIGLAAPQVGVRRRVFVVDVGEEGAPRVKRGFVNPAILERKGAATAEEGCLSIPGIRADVKRAAIVRVEARDENGDRFELTCEGLLARAVQHEIDHLDGILFLDRLSPIQRKLLEGKLKKLRPGSEGPVEAAGTTPTL